MVDTYRAIFGDMSKAFSSAPAPSEIDLPEITTAELAKAEANAVGFAWTNRVLRTGRAALLLDERGFSHEASPLVRSILEHAIALHWLADRPGDAVQSLVRSRQEQVRKLETAQESGWRLSDTVKSLIAEVVAVETDSDTLGGDRLLSVLHQAAEYGLASLYQAWLIESWSTHASLASAHPYYEPRILPSGQTELALLRQPKDMGINISAQVVIASYFALAGYQNFMPGEALVEALANFGSRLAVLSGK